MRNWSRLLLSVVALMLFSGVTAQKQKETFCNTCEILPTDSQNDIIYKAAHVIPTANQLSALQDEFIAFVHWGPNTFTRREWGTGLESPSIFNPTSINTDQWCEAIRAAGMRKVLLTVKHHDGFVLWQSRYTNHGIMSSPILNGKADVLRCLSASCHKFGLKLGIYLSPCDLHEIEVSNGRYGNGSAYSMRTIPRQVDGRPFKCKKTFKFYVDDYNEYFLNQLYELLTEYGPIDEVWFDGAHPKQKGGQRYIYSAWKQLIHELAPRAVVFGREDIRWCGNEAGRTRQTEWNVIAYEQNPDTTNVFHDMTAEDLGSREILYGARFLHYQQPETDTSIRDGWFYRDDEKQDVRTADDVFDIYERSVGGNCTFLLNIPPNREGRFSEIDVDVLKDVGNRIRSTYSENLFAAAKGAKQLLDDNINTYVNLPVGKVLKLVNPKLEKINRIVLQEAVAKRSERVERFAVDAYINGEWEEIARATNIGYKRILRFPTVETSQIRLRILEARLVPAIASFSAHYYEQRPPQLIAKRTSEGMVSLSKAVKVFKKGVNIIKNEIVEDSYAIHYTTDGTEPNVNSARYLEPFFLERGEVRAMAISNAGVKGPISKTVFGVLKSKWKALIYPKDATSDSSASLAFDNNSNTYCEVIKRGNNPILSVDLGKNYSIHGFSYTPPTKRGIGLVSKGVFQISEDGKVWKDVESFEFGNLVNSPTKRTAYFKKTIISRFVRIVATQIEGTSETVGIAEFDIL